MQAKKRHVRGFVPHKPVVVVQGTSGLWLVSMRRVDGSYALACNCPRFTLGKPSEDGTRCPHCLLVAQYLERPTFRASMASPNARTRWPEQHRMYVLTHGCNERVLARRGMRAGSDGLSKIFG